MNIAEYEALEKRTQDDPEFRDRLSSQAFYAAGRSRDPQFTAYWAHIPKTDKDAALKLGLEVILALVDDYTTPGCGCRYCTWDEVSESSRLIMCEKRWAALPPETRSEIAESCSD